MADTKEKKYVSDNAQLMAEWDWEKNNELGLYPDKLTCGSNKNVWWRCEKGHEWKAKINNRVYKNNSCPYCAGRKICLGYNDLATTHPTLSSEWHPSKNGSLTPKEVSKGTTKKVWWLGKCGHEWEDSVCHRTNGRNCPICAGKQIIMGHNDLDTMYPDIAAEWHPTKNGSLTPKMVTPGTDNKVWWLGRCGHEWKASIYSRVNGTGCPHCLAERHTSFPEQAILYYMQKITLAENRNTQFGKEIDIWLPDLSIGIEYNGFWHHNKEKSDLQKISFFSKMGIRIITVKEGQYNAVQGDVIQYIYSAKNKDSLNWAIKELFQLIGLDTSKINVSSDASEIYFQYITLCKENSLLKHYPNLAKEWHPTKNGAMSPEQILPKSDKLVWWQCSRGHEWQATPNARTSLNRGCPYCSGKKVLMGFNDLKTTHPFIAVQWHPEKNQGLSPCDVSHGSSKKVWWLGECGHEWEATINNRTSSKQGCPFCAGQKILIGFNDLATTHPHIALEWHPTKNGALSPQDVSKGTTKKVWWLGKCGHEWKASIGHRTRGIGCPICYGRKTRNE